MKVVYEGQIIEARYDIDYDFIEIISDKTYRIPKNSFFIIPTSSKLKRSENTYLNSEQQGSFKTDIQEDKIVVVKYIKNKEKEETTGLLRFNEFSKIRVYEPKCVHSEAFTMKIPFQFEENIFKNYRTLKIKNFYGKNIKILTDVGYAVENGGEYKIFGNAKMYRIVSENLIYELKSSPYD